MITNLIGNTPMAEIHYTVVDTFKESIVQHNSERTASVIKNLEGKLNRDCVVYSKCEWYNLSGSIKDRVAYRMIANAFLSNKLLKEQEIVEVTSGNMGLSLAAVGKHFGHKVTIFMPKNMSSERIKLLELLVSWEQFYLRSIYHLLYFQMTIRSIFQLIYQNQYTLY